MRRLLEWKYMNQQTNTTTSTITTNNKASAGSFPSQEERYKKILAQLSKENKYPYTVSTLTDNALVFEIELDAVSHKTITVAIVYKPYTNPPVWQLTVNNRTTVDYKDWNEVLEVFEFPGIINDISSLKEPRDISMVSVAEDFETYNNLWSKEK